MDDVTYAVQLEVPEGDVFKVVGDDVRQECDHPCTLQLPRGVYRVESKTAKTDLILEGPVRIEPRRGSRTLKTTGFWLFVGGAVVTGTAVLLPALLCGRGNSDPRDEAPDLNCEDYESPAFAGWVTVIALGIGAMVTGGVLYIANRPYLRTKDTAVAVIPQVTPRLTGLGLTLTF